MLEDTPSNRFRNIKCRSRPIRYTSAVVKKTRFSPLREIVRGGSYITMGRTFIDIDRPTIEMRLAYLNGKRKAKGTKQEKKRL